MIRLGWDDRFMSEKSSISENDLRVCLWEEYDLTVVTLDVLPLGLDTMATVYRVVCEDGACYFLKVKSGAFYEPSCFVPGYLREQGIEAVVAPLATKRNALWAQVGKWTLMLYPFIDGDAGSHLDMSDGNWREVGSIFRQIHGVMLPPHGFPLLREETFDTTEYGRWVRVLETQHISAEGGSEVERALRSSWRAHQSTIHAVMSSLEKLAGLLQGRAGPKVTCHADLHPGNLLRDRAGHIFVVDWDDVMLAPKERDFIFVRDGSAPQEIAPFFQGYGETEVDWVTLTYYRCERVIQDVIVCAQNVLLREDLGEETRAVEARLFDEVLAEGGEVDAVRAAACHLSSDLRFQIP
jgi:spectinomycin phosphotransferase